MKIKKQIPACELPVMAAHCKTCPFKPDDSGKFQDMALAMTVINRTLFQGQQICHGTEGKNRKPNHRCKGAFEFCLPIYERLGFTNFIVRKARKLDTNILSTFVNAQHEQKSGNI